MIILLAVLFGGVVISGGVYYAVFRAMPWQLHDSDTSFKQEYKLHCYQAAYSTTQDLTFNHFLNLYQINPNKWKFFDGGKYNTYGSFNDHYRLFYYPGGTKGKVQIIFSKKDYIKFRKWNSDRIFDRELDQTEKAKVVSEKNSAAACQFLLEDVQKDIDKMREEAQRQIDEARELTNSVAARRAMTDIALTIGPETEESAAVYVTCGDNKVFALNDGNEVMYEVLD
jgi:hypothetical protein